MYVIFDFETHKCGIGHKNACGKIGHIKYGQSPRRIAIHKFTSCERKEF